MAPARRPGAALPNEWCAPGVEIVRRWPGWQVHATDGGQVITSRGLQVAAVDADSLSPVAGADPPIPLARARRAIAALAQVRDRPVAALPGAARVASLVDVAHNALRLGVHAAVATRSGAVVAAVTGGLWRRGIGLGWRQVLPFEGFRKPARGGLCADSRGRIWLAEYALNDQRRQPIRLWCSSDDGESFAIAHAFAPGEVRHLHFVVEDPYDRSIWIGTGDRDSESALWRSGDGLRWERQGGGSQIWRATGLAFLPDAVVWGSDAGSDAPTFANVAVRLPRGGAKPEVEQALQGPAHGVTAIGDGRALVSTGCEGGANETTGRAHLWLREADGRWREIASWRKGVQPAPLQYAVIHFATGQGGNGEPWVAARGVAGAPLEALRLRIGAA